MVKANLLLLPGFPSQDKAPAPIPSPLPGPCLAVGLSMLSLQLFSSQASKTALVFSILGNREIATAGTENQCDLKTGRSLVGVKEWAVT